MATRLVVVAVAARTKPAMAGPLGLVVACVSCNVQSGFVESRHDGDGPPFTMPGDAQGRNGV